MRFDFEDYGESADIDLAPFAGADVIVALAGDRFVDYAAKPAVAVRSVRDDAEDARLREGEDEVVVFFSGSGEEEQYEGYEAVAGPRVVVFDFEDVLPDAMCGASGVMAALDAVAGEVLG